MKINFITFSKFRFEMRNHWRAIHSYVIPIKRGSTSICTLSCGRSIISSSFSEVINHHLPNSSFNNTHRQLYLPDKSSCKSCSSSSTRSYFSSYTPTTFQSESEYHSVADSTLENIQDTLEIFFEDHDIDAEINYASGVLTIHLPANGNTWVLNKQTPNQQIWWSSPISGPRRYEYALWSQRVGEEQQKRWIFTRFIDHEQKEEWLDSKFLGEALSEEMRILFGLHLELDA